MTKKKPVNDQLLEQQLMISGLPLSEYNRLKAAESELRKLKKTIAECCRVDFGKAAEAKETYRKASRELDVTSRNNGKVEILHKLEETWQKEIENTQVVVDGNKAAELFIKYAAEMLTERERRAVEYYEDDLPESTKIKIE